MISPTMRTCRGAVKSQTWDEIGRRSGTRSFCSHAVQTLISRLRFRQWRLWVSRVHRRANIPQAEESMQSDPGQLQCWNPQALRVQIRVLTTTFVGSIFFWASSVELVFNLRKETFDWSALMTCALMRRANAYSTWGGLISHMCKWWISLWFGGLCAI